MTKLVSIGKGTPGTIIIAVPVQLAGEHPGWSIDVPEYQHKRYPPLNSPTGCQIFKSDLI